MWVARHLETLGDDSDGGVIRVLLNLGTNALKFTPQCEIRIEALAQDTALVSARHDPPHLGTTQERIDPIVDGDIVSAPVMRGRSPA